jgi:hypothetical protein
MSFVHPLLLGGLLLVGIPVLIHLIMQQKPKRLLFPAFRFLVQKHRTNQRRLRLRHLLLLALRMLLVALICLALARPKLFSDRLQIGSNRPVAAVLLFDTSMSMGYEVSKQSRLEDAKKRALELLGDLPEASRVAILDSAEPGGKWQPSLPEARKQVAALKLRPVNAPVTRQMRQAYRLFQELDQGGDDSSEPLPRFLYVFSDRTVACWDASEAKGLHQPEGLNAVFVDVGVDAPIDLGIVGVELPRQTAHPGDHVEIRVPVRAVGADAENDLTCLRVGDKTAIPRAIKLAAGKSDIKTFAYIAARTGETDETRGRLPVGYHQVEIRLGNGDALPVNNIVYATFKIQEGRRVLLIADDPGKREEDGDAGQWVRTLRASHTFPYEVVTPKKAAELSTNKLNEFEAVCLIDVADPTLLWDKLTPFAEGGKGLAVVLGGESWPPNVSAYNLPAAQRLLGAKLLKDVVNRGNDPGDPWKELQQDAPKTTLHPLILPFRDAADKGQNFTEETFPRASFYRRIQPVAETARAIANYVDKDNKESRPALVENHVGKGHVLLFTSAMDARLVRNLAANNYFSTGAWFGMALILVSTGYLAGDADMPSYNFLCGQTATVPLPASQKQLFTVVGPGLTGVSVPRGKGENTLRIPQAVLPGNYLVYDPDTNKPVAAFSLNVGAEESQLERVPVEEIESLLGAGSVLTLDRRDNLGVALQGHWLQPVELFPWLMIFVLLFLAVENLLANKFYRRVTEEPTPPLAASPSDSATPQAALAAEAVEVGA